MGAGQLSDHVMVGNPQGLQAYAGSQLQAGSIVLEQVDYQPCPTPSAPESALPLFDHHRTRWCGSACPPVNTADWRWQKVAKVAFESVLAVP